MLKKMKLDGPLKKKLVLMNKMTMILQPHNTFVKLKLVKSVKLRIVVVTVIEAVWKDAVVSALMKVSKCHKTVVKKAVKVVSLLKVQLS